MARQRQTVKLRGVPAAKINVARKVARVRANVGKRKG